MRVLRYLVVSWIVAVLLLAACGPASTSAPEVTTAEPQATAPPRDSIPLEGTEWTLSSLRGQDLVAGSSLTLGFYEDNYMEGSAGCNSYGVDYTASGPAFRIDQVHRTDFKCEEPPGIMSQDEAFFEALGSIAAYRATEEHLEFDDAAGETILVYVRKRPPVVDPVLKDTEWLLTSLLGDSLLEGSRITLNLGGQGFTGFAGCNNYGGEYEAASGGVLQVTEIAHTEMDCASPEGVMEQEAAYIQALRSSATYQLTGDGLEIADAGRATILVFEGKDQFATQPGDLVRTAWRLVSMDGEQPSGESTYTLAFFSGDVLGGDAGCRDYLATYQATGDDLVLLSEAMFDAGCRVEEADLDGEAAFLGILAPKADVAFGDGRLEIYGERGGLLVFESLPEEDALDLEGPTWTLQAFVGPNPYVEEPESGPMPVGPLAGTTIDLRFEDGLAQGSSGCNTYSAPYVRTDNSLSFGAIAVKDVACPSPEGIMEQEAHYLELLSAMTGNRVYGDRLWLETEDGRALVFQER